MIVSNLFAKVLELCLSNFLFERHTTKTTDISVVLSGANYKTSVVDIDTLSNKLAHRKNAGSVSRKSVVEAQGSKRKAGSVVGVDDHRLNLW